MLKRRFGSHSLAAGAVLAALGITDLTAFAATPPKPKAGGGEQPTLSPGNALVFDKNGEVYVTEWPTAPAAAAPAADGTALSAEDQERLKNFETLTNQQAEEIKKLQKTVEEEKAGRQLSSDKTAVDDLVRQFKITPATAEELKKMAEESPAAFAASLPIFQKSEPIAALAGTGKNNVDASTLASGGDGGRGESEAAQLKKLSEEYMKENPGTSYGEAFSAVCRKNPDLARAYREAASVGG